MIGTIKPIYTLKYPAFNRHSFHLILFPIEDSFCYSHPVTPRLNVKEGGSRILFICTLCITLGCRAADSCDQIWDICAFKCGYSL